MILSLYNLVSHIEKDIVKAMKILLIMLSFTKLDATLE